ncbi:MAG: acetyl-CoA C-acetyltransferase [Leptospiraceae bacterium]|nr:acetyl-CoA C-acetyltransferase [Leptospiraceae bacterium]
MQAVYIIDGVRTPFGNFGGALQNEHPRQLGVHVTRQALNRCGLSAQQVDEVFFGNVIPADSQSIYLARHIALHSGCDVRTPALTVNRLCGSGLEAVVQAAFAIQSGRASLCVAGGVESMSQAPFIAQGARWGNRLGSVKLEDMLLEGLSDGYVDLPMGMTAEKLAARYKISRAEQDDWATTSQRRAEAARDAGRLAEEIAPITLKTRKGEIVCEHDEFIKGAAGVEKLPALKAAFQKDGTVTAGNASGINDGAGALVVASADFVKANNIKPLARIVSHAVTGCAPEEMGIGPALAIPRALQSADLKQSDLNLVEVNEAFAAQYLAVQKELDLNPEITNVNGGAIALGHPLGASGTRVLLTLCKELRRRGQRYGAASLCIGGGQGIAMIVEVQND